jgi:dCTP deaminase
MLLADTDIKKALKSGEIKLTPAPDLEEQLGSVSLDLRLGKKFAVFNHASIPYIDPFKKELTEGLMKRVEITDQEKFIIQPGEFVLATTIEDVQVSDHLVARLEGRSSLGRLGIVVHSTASVFDPGWRGKVVMELGNLGKMPVALHPGMRICALTFEKVTQAVETPYHQKASAKYKDQQSPIPSRYFKDLDKK